MKFLIMVDNIFQYIFSNWEFTVNTNFKNKVHKSIRFFIGVAEIIE